MPSTYTSNNKIQKIATGEQSGTWGNTTNTNFDLFDTAIDGFVNITLSGTTHTLNIPDGSAGDGRNKVLVFTGTLAATNTISVTPNTVKKHYYVQNNTTGSQNIVLSQGSGSSVTIKPGYSSIVYLDGAGSGAAVKEVLTSLKLTALLEATGAVLNGSSSGSTTLQASATASGTLTLPAATDTLVGKATTDTFTNKTFDTAGTGNVLRINSTQVSAVTGTGSVVLATSPTLVTPLLGTPTSGTLTNCTGLPVSTGISGLGANVATFLATPSSANLASAVTDETGSGALVFATSPVLVTPILGTPNSGNLANCFGYNVNVLAGAGTGVREALAVNVGTAGSLVVNGGVLGTPSSGTLTNCTGLPVSTGISGLGSGVATFLATPSSTNLAAAVTDETGTGALVFGTSPTIATPTITTSATVPLVIGGTGTTSTLTLRSTSGVGTTGADIIFQAGNNGATEVMRLQNGGNVGIGTSSPSRTLDVNGSCIFGSVVGVVAGDSTPAQIGVLTFGQSTASTYAWIQSWSSRPLAINPSGNNVGIGTSSPSQKLDVVGNLLLSGQSTADQYIRVGAGRSGNGYSYIDLQGDTTYSNGLRLIRVNSGANAVSGIEHRGTGNLQIVTQEAAPIVFFTNGSSERMRIESSGNVSINTSTSGSKLQVVGTASLGSGSLNSFGSGYGVTVTGIYGKATATDNTNLLLLSDDALASNPLSLSLSVVGNSTATSRYAIISCGEYGTGNYRSLAFQPYGGNVGIGTSSPAYQLQLSTDSAAKPTTNTWTIASDSRLKTVKGEYQKGLTEICQVRPVRYEYNGKAGFTADGKEQVSILAQELMQVFPECVDTFKGKLEQNGPEIDLYNYNGHAITFALINAIKELKAEIDILKARN